MKKETTGPPQILRYLVFLLLGLFILTFSLIYVYPVFILPRLSGLPWHVHLLVVVLYWPPFGLLLLYLIFKLVLSPTMRMPLKGIRQWVVTYLLLLSYGLLWVFLAFIFESYAPFVPVVFGGVILPTYIFLLLVIILTRTRLKSRVERLLERLFGTNSKS